MQQRNIHIITTGGTIEKFYNESTGKLSNGATLIEDFIDRELRLINTKLHIHSIMNKDSLDMNEMDRKKIYRYIDLMMEDRIPIIIIHGTDTMVQTACYSKKNLIEPLAPVIFTGAMRPIGMQRSDAKQNLAEALMVSQLLSPGVYLSFHNKIFAPERTRKNYQTNTFEDICDQDARESSSPFGPC